MKIDLQTLNTAALTKHYNLLHVLDHQTQTTKWVTSQQVDRQKFFCLVGTQSADDSNILETKEKRQ